MRFGARQLSPGGREFSLIRQAVIKEDRELLRLDRVQWRVLIFGPPANTALRKTADEEIETNTVVAQHFESRSATISKYKERTGERIFRQLAFAKRGKPIDAVTEGAIRSPETE